MTGIVQHVKKQLKSEMPEKIAIIMDGWSHLGTHFFAVHGLYENKNGETSTPLLALSPFLDETDLSAESHVSFIEEIFHKISEKSKSSILFVVGDNEPKNKKIAKILKIPLIGCASHLAIKCYFEEYGDIFNKLHMLMKNLANVKNRALLRQAGCDLMPVMRCKTRWSTDFNPLKQYRELKEYINRNMEVTEFLPSPREIECIEQLIQKAEKFESVTKKFKARK